jgi:hypothetical protein
MNADHKNIMQVDAEGNRYVDPSTLMAAFLCESSGRNYDELWDSVCEILLTRPRVPLMGHQSQR